MVRDSLKLSGVSGNGRAVSEGVGSSGVRDRTGDLRVMNPPLIRDKINNIKPLRLPETPPAHYLPTDTRQSDPDLAIVVESWGGLPAAIRAGIVAMVRSVYGEGGVRDGSPDRL